MEEPLTVTEPGTVIENMDFRARVTIQADDVVLRNVRITTGDYWVLINYGARTRVEHSTLVGSWNSQAAIGDVEGGNFRGQFLNISGSADGVKMGAGSQLYDSFIHDLAVGHGTHNDGVELNAAYGAEVVHNTILNRNSQTSCIIINDISPRKPARITIKSNKLAGGGYTIYGGAPSSGVTVMDNTFSSRFFPNSGYWGVAAYWQTDGNRWSGNIWGDGPQATQAITRP